jgi:hypothetical protein
VVETPETATWLKLGTRRVVSLFVDALARSHGWKRLYLVSPWISEFGDEAGITFQQFIKRLKDDNATGYVVTRPPVEAWHVRAVEMLANSGKANIVTVEDLHTKLYCADTDQGSFALFGSANFTHQSLINREIGVFMRASGNGKPLVRSLFHEAADIYRSPGRQLICKRQF